jgi:hypothetical protein
VHEYDAGESIKGEVMEDDDDDMSVSDESLNSVSNLLVDHGGKEYKGWKPRYSIPISGITTRLQQKRTVHLFIAFQNVKQERDVLFDTIDDANKFCEEVEKQNRLQEERLQERLKASLGDIKLPKMERITLLFEIVSAYDLPIGDFTSSDPIVVAVLGYQKLHQTAHLSNT